MSRDTSHLNPCRTSIERAGSMTARHNRSRSMTNLTSPIRRNRNRRFLHDPDTSCVENTPHWSANRKRNAWFLLFVLLLGVGTIVVLANAEAQHASQTGGTQPGTVSTPVVTASPPVGTLVPTARVFTRAAQAHLYPFPQTNAGLMQPTVDERGNLWVGEMYANRLARLDSQTGVVTSWQTPHGQNG